MLTTRQLAAFLGVGEGLLAKWRHQKIGPTYVKLTPGPSGAVRYPREDLRAYITGNTITPGVR
jgi:hypothetical protein